jgi:hypothetical protein
MTQTLQIILFINDIFYLRFKNNYALNLSKKILVQMLKFANYCDMSPFYVLVKIILTLYLHQSPLIHYHLILLRSCSLLEVQKTTDL